jgi:hypothetical protein
MKLLGQDIVTTDEFAKFKTEAHDVVAADVEALKNQSLVIKIFAGLGGIAGIVALILVLAKIL